MSLSASANNGNKISYPVKRKSLAQEQKPGLLERAEDIYERVTEPVGKFLTGFTPGGGLMVSTLNYMGGGAEPTGIKGLARKSVGWLSAAGTLGAFACAAQFVGGGVAAATALFTITALGACGVANLISESRVFG